MQSGVKPATTPRSGRYNVTMADDWVPNEIEAADLRVRASELLIAASDALRRAADLHDEAAAILDSLGDDKPVGDGTDRH